MCLSNYKFVNLAQFYQNRIGNDIQFIAIAANYNVTDIVLKIIYTILYRSQIPDWKANPLECHRDSW